MSHPADEYSHLGGNRGGITHDNDVVDNAHNNNNEDDDNDVNDKNNSNNDRNALSSAALPPESASDHDLDHHMPLLHSPTAFHYSLTTIDPHHHHLHHHDNNIRLGHDTHFPAIKWESPQSWGNTLVPDDRLHGHPTDALFHSAPHMASSAAPPSHILQNLQFQRSVTPDIPDPILSLVADHNIAHNSKAHTNKKDTVKEPSTRGSQPSNATTLETDTWGKVSKQRRPCDHCRRKKTKCVIIPSTTNCIQCESKGLTCTYTLSASRRKAADSDSASTRKRKQAGDNSTTRSSTANELELLTSSVLAHHIKPPNVPIRETMPVQDYSLIENSLLKKTLSLQLPRLSFYIGSSCYLHDASLMNVIVANQASTQQEPNQQIATNEVSELGSAIEQVNLSLMVALRKVSDQEHFLLRKDSFLSSFQHPDSTAEVDAIERFVAPHGQVLINLYFRIIHPSYPILHKKVFLEKYSRTHREFSAPLLAAVYVLAIQWWNYDPYLYQYPKPNAKHMLQLALEHFLLDIVKRPKLSGVQAGLLLLQCKRIIPIVANDTGYSTAGSGSGNSAGSGGVSGGNGNGGGGVSAAGGSSGSGAVLVSTGSIKNDETVLSIGPDYSDWILYSQVGSLAEELGLGADCSTWKLPAWERGLRTRLAWAVYVEDKWLSLRYGRPSHISDSNWMVPPLKNEDFPEKHGEGDERLEGSVDIGIGKMVFMLFVSLSQIASDLIDQLYSLRALSQITTIELVLGVAKSLQLRLREWFHSVPENLRLPVIQPRKLCANGYLQLAYFAAELTLHRRITSAIYQQQLSCESPPPPAELVQVCRSAARTRLLSAIDFVRNLKPEHIHSFWHSSASQNFTLIGTFAALLYVSSPTAQEAAFYRDQAFNYRWILKISSKGFEQMADALFDLDSVWRHIPGLFDDGPGLPSLTERIALKKQKMRFAEPVATTPIWNQQACTPDLRRVYSSNNVRMGVQRTGSDCGNDSAASTSPFNRRYGEEGRGEGEAGPENSPGTGPKMTPQNANNSQYDEIKSPQHPISRGEVAYVDSPQSSQALSPNDKRQS